MSSDTPEIKEPKKKSILLRLGCGLFVAALILILLASLLGDKMLKATVEKIVAKEAGIPVNFDKLNISLIGRPSISLYKVNVGKNKLAYLDQLTVTVNSLDTLLSSESFIVNIDSGGININIPENPWEADSELNILYNKLMAGEDSKNTRWALPSVKLRSVDFDFPATYGGRAKILLDALEISGISSEELKDNYPEISLSMRNAQLSAGAINFLSSGRIEAKVISSQNNINVKTFEAGSITYKDSITASGKTSSAILLTSLKNLVPEKIKNQPSAPAGTALNITGAIIKKLDFRFDAGVKNPEARLALNAENLSLDNAEINDGLYNLGSLKTENIIILEKTKGHSAELKLNNMDLHISHKFPASIIPGIEISAKNILFADRNTSYYSGKISIADVQAVIPEHSAKTDTISVEKITLNTTAAALAATEEKGLLLADNIGRTLKNWESIPLANAYNFANGNRTDIINSSILPTAKNAEEKLPFKLINIGELKTSDLVLAVKNADTAKMEDVFSFNSGNIEITDIASSLDKIRYSCRKINLTDTGFSSAAENSQDFAVSFKKGFIGSINSDLPVIPMKEISLEQTDITGKSDKLKVGYLKTTIENSPAENFNISSLKANSVIGEISYITADKSILLAKNAESSLNKALSYLSGKSPSKKPDVSNNQGDIRINDLSVENIKLDLKCLAEKQHKIISLALAAAKGENLSLSSDSQEIRSFRADQTGISFPGEKNNSEQLNIGKIRIEDFSHPLYKTDNRRSDIDIDKLVFLSEAEKENVYLTVGNLKATCNSTAPVTLSSVICDGVSSNISKDTSGKWDIEKSLTKIISTFDSFADTSNTDAIKGEKKAPFSVEIKRFACNSVKNSFSTRSAANRKNTINIIPGTLEALNIILIDQLGDLRLYIADIKSRLASVELITADNETYYASAENLSATQLDSYRLAKGTASSNISLKNGKLVKANGGNAPEVILLFDEIMSAIQESSERRTVIKNVNCSKPKIVTSIDSHNEVQLSNDLEKISGIISTLLSQSEKPQDNTSPLYLAELDINDGNIKMAYSLNNRNVNPIHYIIKDFAIKGRKLSYLMPSVGGMEITGVLSAPNLTERLSNISIILTELSMEESYQKANFAITSTIEKIPTELMAAIANKHGVLLKGPEGYASAIISGKSRKGKLHIPIDLMLDKISARYQPRTNNQSGGIGDIMMILGLPEIPFNDKKIEKAVTITGTITKPKFIYNKDALAEAMGINLKQGKINPMDILKGGAIIKPKPKEKPAPEPEPEIEDDQPEAAQDTSTGKTESRKNALFDILGKAGIDLPDSNQAEEEKTDDGTEEKELSKKERRLNKAKAIIDIFQDVLNKNE